MSIINVDVAKCVGCNACIKSCPAKDANIASFDDALPPVLGPISKLVYNRLR